MEDFGSYPDALLEDDSGALTTTRRRLKRSVAMRRGEEFSRAVADPMGNAEALDVIKNAGGHGNVLTSLRSDVTSRDGERAQWSEEAAIKERVAEFQTSQHVMRQTDAGFREISKPERAFLGTGHKDFDELVTQVADTKRYVGIVRLASARC
jgi:hypothetical protein